MPALADCWESRTDSTRPPQIWEKPCFSPISRRKWGWPKLSSQPQSSCHTRMTAQQTFRKYGTTLVLFTSQRLRSALQDSGSAPSHRSSSIPETSVRAFYSSIEKCWEIIWVQNMAFLGSNITVKKAIQSKCRLPSVNTAQTAGILTWPLKRCLKKKTYCNASSLKLGVLYRTHLRNPGSPKQKTRSFCYVSSGTCPDCLVISANLSFHLLQWIAEGECIY